MTRRSGGGRVGLVRCRCICAVRGVGLRTLRYNRPSLGRLGLLPRSMCRSLGSRPTTTSSKSLRVQHDDGRNAAGIRNHVPREEGLDLCKRLNLPSEAGIAPRLPAGCLVSATFPADPGGRGTPTARAAYVAAPSRRAHIPTPSRGRPAWPLFSRQVRDAGGVAERVIPGPHEPLPAGAMLSTREGVPTRLD